MSSNRVGYGQRRIKITPELIEAWLVGEQRVRTDLPDDARMTMLYPSDLGGHYILIMESKEWDELAEGEEIPLMVPDVEPATSVKLDGRRLTETDGRHAE